MIAQVTRIATLGIALFAIAGCVSVPESKQGYLQGRFEGSDLNVWFENEAAHFQTADTTYSVQRVL